MTYKVVFDVAEAGYKSWSFPAFGLIFVVIGVLLVLARRHLPGWWGQSPRASAVFAFGWLSFAVLWTVTSFLATYGEYSSLIGAHREGRTTTVEGLVSGFVPMPYAGHAVEKFCVSGHCFEYSDYLVSGGFNNTSSHGGPIKEGLNVRVTFWRGVITKLEVAQ